MKRLLSLVVLLLSVFVFTAFAHPPARKHMGPRGHAGFQGLGPGAGGMHMGWGMRHPGQHPRMMADRDAERVSMRGRVVSVETSSYGRRSGNGVVLKVESESRVVPVHLGPAWKLADLRDQVKMNDRVEVVGKRVMRGGQPVVIAGEIKREGDREMITLRPDNERPMHKMKMKKMKPMRREVY